MNSNKVELSGLILSCQDTQLNSQPHKLIGIQNIQDGIAISLPVYVPEHFSNEITLHSNIVINGYLSFEDTQLVVVASNVSNTLENSVPEMPADFMENPPLDESYFDAPTPKNSEAEVYTLPLEAFSKDELNTTEQGVFITSDNRAIDLNTTELPDHLIAPGTSNESIDYDELWKLSSGQLMIEVLKRDHSQAQKEVMIGIALSKEINEKYIMTHHDLEVFFSKFSDIIKLGTRKFNGQHIPFIQVRMSHYAGGQYIFRFISNIFSEAPTSPLDWLDFAETYNHLNPRFFELQMQAQELENLFKRSESSEVLTTDLTELQNKNLSIQRSAKIRLNGMSPVSSTS